MNTKKETWKIITRKILCIFFFSIIRLCIEIRWQRTQNIRLLIRNWLKSVNNTCVFIKGVLKYGKIIIAPFKLPRWCIGHGVLQNGVHTWSKSVYCGYADKYFYSHKQTSKPETTAGYTLLFPGNKYKHVIFNVRCNV